MQRVSTVTLGGVDYQVPQMVISQLERITELFAQGGPRVAFGVIRIGLERSEPKVGDPGTLAVTKTELGEAVEKILQMSELSSGKTRLDRLVIRAIILAQEAGRSAADAFDFVDAARDSMLKEPRPGEANAGSPSPA